MIFGNVRSLLNDYAIVRIVSYKYFNKTGEKEKGERERKKKKKTKKKKNKNKRRTEIS